MRPQTTPLVSSPGDPLVTRRVALDADHTDQYIIYGVAGAVVLYVFACIWLRGGFHWYSASKKTNIRQKRCYRCGHGVFGISRADPVKDAPGRFQHDLTSDSDNCGNRWYSKLILLEAERYHGGQETWASSLTCGSCGGRGDVERGEK
jgi:hypothetical protein